MLPQFESNLKNGRQNSKNIEKMDFVNRNFLVNLYTIFGAREVFQGNPRRQGNPPDRKGGGPLSNHSIIGTSGRIK